MSKQEQANLDSNFSGAMKEELEKVRRDARNDGRDPDKAVEEFLRTIKLDETTDKMINETESGIEGRLK